MSQSYLIVIVLTVKCCFHYDVLISRRFHELGVSTHCSFNGAVGFFHFKNVDGIQRNRKNFHSPNLPTVERFAVVMLDRFHAF